jgi:hypothetical protein
VFDHSDAGDLVERRFPRELPIVPELDTTAIAEPRRGDALTRQLRLRLAQRDAEREHSIPLRGVDDETAPSTADVEESLARREPKLPTDQVELRFLRAVEVVVAVGEISARVHQPRVEPQRVKGVADVVVKANRVAIALCRVTATGQLWRHS